MDKDNIFSSPPISVLCLSLVFSVFIFLICLFYVPVYWIRVSSRLRGSSSDVYQRLVHTLAEIGRLANDKGKGHQITITLDAKTPAAVPERLVRDRWVEGNKSWRCQKHRMFGRDFCGLPIAKHQRGVCTRCFLPAPWVSRLVSWVITTATVLCMSVKFYWWKNGWVD